MKKHLRLSFLALSISIALLSTILGLSATLTQAQNQTSYFVVEADGAFGIELTREDYSTATKILPGQSMPMNPTVTNNSTIPVLLFAEIEASSDFSIDGVQSGWTLMKTLKDGVEYNPEDNEPGVFTYIYYYGSNGAMTSLSSNGYTKIFDSVTLSDAFVPPMDGEDNVDFAVSVTAHAIQAAGYEGKGINEVWEVAQ